MEEYHESGYKVHRGASASPQRAKKRRSFSSQPCARFRYEKIPQVPNAALRRKNVAPNSKIVLAYDLHDGLETVKSEELRT